MKTFALLVCILTLAAPALCAEPAADSTDSSGSPSFLFVLSAQSGGLKDAVLTLRGTPAVVYFSDRPDRIAGHMRVEEFIALWDKGPESFKDDPPNATLSVFQDKGAANAVVELLSVAAVGDGVRFSIRILEGEIGSSFGAASLFVDLIMRGGGPGPGATPYTF